MFCRYAILFCVDDMTLVNTAHYLVQSQSINELNVIVFYEILCFVRYSGLCLCGVYDHGRMCDGNGT